MYTFLHRKNQLYIEHFCLICKMYTFDQSVLARNHEQKTVEYLFHQVLHSLCNDILLMQILTYLAHLVFCYN